MKYHDIIAAIGEGAAHPGAFQGTMKFLEEISLSPGLRILEVGCGTGRTACLLAEMGHDVTALDRSDSMLEKAKRRAQLQKLNVRYLKGDAQSLPFEDHEFDVVFVESVTLFVDPQTAIKEYNRVLRAGGQLLDREMYRSADHPRLLSVMRQLYGSSDIPAMKEWKEMLRASGFRSVQIWKPEGDEALPFSANNRSAQHDPYQIVDFDKLSDPELSHFMFRNEAFIKEFQDHLSYGVFIAHK
jgi:ubiquinone/menaquinone biosynthesis C-methylase UbiE